MTCGTVFENYVKNEFITIMLYKTENLKKTKNKKKKRKNKNKKDC